MADSCWKHHWAASLLYLKLDARGAVGLGLGAGVVISSRPFIVVIVRLKDVDFSLKF